MVRFFVRLSQAGWIETDQDGFNAAGADGLETRYSVIPSGSDHNSLRGKEPNHFGQPTCLNTSSRRPTGGAIGETELPWAYCQERRLGALIKRSMEREEQQQQQQEALNQFI